MTTTTKKRSRGCSVDGCTGKHEAKGYCNRHYLRLKKTGDPHSVAMVIGDPDRRFAALHTEDESGCWPWVGWVDRNGYAKFTIGQQAFLAHRWSYVRHVGPIPDGLVIDHLCRNRRCVNPAHLEVVTQKENALRGIGVGARNAARAECIRGHAFDAANTYVNPTTGARKCRRCAAERMRSSNASRRTIQ